MPRVNGRKPPLLRRGHYWVGLALALPLVMLAVTGSLLNHSNDLKLDQSHTAQPWLLALYGVEAMAPKTGYLIDNRWLSHARDSLWLDDRKIDDHLTPPRSAVLLDNLIVVALPGQLRVYTRNGRHVEQIDLPQALRPLDAIASADGRLLVRGNNRISSSDADFSRWTETTQVWPGSVAQQPLPPELRSRIREKLAASTLTWEKIILDAHSGHLFGAWGPIVLDLVALITLVLAITGCLLWLRRPPRSGR